MFTSTRLSAVCLNGASTSNSRYYQPARKPSMYLRKTLQYVKRMLLYLISAASLAYLVYSFSSSKTVAPIASKLKSLTNLETGEILKYVDPEEGSKEDNFKEIMAKLREQNSAPEQFYRKRKPRSKGSKTSTTHGPTKPSGDGIQMTGLRPPTFNSKGGATRSPKSKRGYFAKMLSELED